MSGTVSIMANEPMVRGPVAQRVSANLRLIRKDKGLGLSDVSERMAEFGQPISINGLSKIENGTRRVDVDDLTALALALDVTPNRLLLSARADRSMVALAPTVKKTAHSAWLWATSDDTVPNLQTAQSELAQVRDSISEWLRASDSR